MKLKLLRVLFCTILASWLIVSCVLSPPPLVMPNSSPKATPGTSSVQPIEETPRPASNLLYDWLQSKPCQPPCWQGITPGQTQAEEAEELLFTHPDISHVEVITSSLFYETIGGEIDWSSKELTGRIQFGGTPAVVFGMKLYQDGNLTLQDVMTVLGEPSHVFAVASSCIDVEDCAVHRLSLIFVESGVALDWFQSDYKPEFGPNWSSFTLIFFSPTLQGFSQAWGNPQVINAIKPWRGMLGFDAYCEGDACPGEPKEPNYEAMKALDDSTPVARYNLIDDWARRFPCSVPCWNTITPGSTSAFEARKQLRQSPGVTSVEMFSDTVGNELSGQIQWQWYKSPSLGGEIRFGGTSALVSGITLFGEPSWPLETILGEYGEPSHLYLSCRQNQQLVGPKMVLLFVSHGFALIDPGRQQMSQLTELWNDYDLLFFEPSLEGFTRAWVDEPIVEQLMPWPGISSVQVDCGIDPEIKPSPAPSTIPATSTVPAENQAQATATQQIKKPMFEKTDLLHDWLLGTPCLPPCWQKITPGKTEAPEAIIVLSMTPGVADFGDSGFYNPPGHIVWSSQEQMATKGRIEYSGEPPLVDSIIVSGNRLWTLADVIAKYGEPSHLYRSCSQSEPKEKIVLLFVKRGLGLIANQEIKQLTNEWKDFDVLFFEASLEGFEQAWDKEAVLQKISPWKGMGEVGLECKD